MACPICSYEDKKMLYRLCDNMKIMGESFPQSPSFIVKCNKCGLLYMDTEASQEDFLTYYKYGAVAPKYYDMFGKEDTDDYYAHLYDLIKAYINSNSSILDIAGAWGEFGSYMKKLGYDDFTDMDPSEKCIKNAEEMGIKTLHTDSISMEGVLEDKYDMVILNHSLEHILNVKSTMNNITRVLKSDGYLFVEIPDVEGYEKENASPFNFLTYEHVLHMSMNDMENLANEYGYQIIDKGYYYKKVSSYPSIYAVMKKGPKKQLAFSDTAENAMLRYLQKSGRTLEEFIEPLRESREELILWGIGASTAILIESFKGCNIKCLIDRNPKRQGIVFNINEKEYAIKPPENVGDGTIVILSIPYYDSISKQIREMGLTNKIVALK